MLSAIALSQSCDDSMMLSLLRDLCDLLAVVSAGVSNSIRTSLNSGTQAGAQSSSSSLSVNEITRAAREVSMQLDKAVSTFLSKTDKAHQDASPAHHVPPRETTAGAAPPFGFGSPGHSTITAQPAGIGAAGQVPLAGNPAMSAQLVASIMLPGVPSYGARGTEPNLLPMRNESSPAMPGSGMQMPCSGESENRSGMAAPPMVHGSWGHAPGAGLLPGAPQVAQAVLLAQQQAMAAQQAALQAQQQLIVAQREQVRSNVGQHMSCCR